MSTTSLTSRTALITRYQAILTRTLATRLVMDMRNSTDDEHINVLSHFHATADAFADVMIKDMPDRQVPVVDLIAGSVLDKLYQQWVRAGETSGAEDSFIVKMTRVVSIETRKQILEHINEFMTVHPISDLVVSLMAGLLENVSTCIYEADTRQGLAHGLSRVAQWVAYSCNALAPDMLTDDVHACAYRVGKMLGGQCDKNGLAWLLDNTKEHSTPLFNDVYTRVTDS